MFLKDLYRRWRTMFYMVLLFLFGQFYFMYKGIETMPFFLMHMYSAPDTTVNSFHEKHLFINGKKFDIRSLSDRETETLMGSLDYFSNLKKSNFYATDTNSIRKRFKKRLPAKWYNYVYQKLTNASLNDTTYLNWWCRYASKVCGEKVNSFYLINTTIVCDPFFHSLTDSALIIKYDKP